MALVSDLITQAFLDIGAIAAGQTPTTEEQTDAFLRLNQMLDSWSREHVSVFTEQHGSFTVTAATSAYTFGVTANSPSWVASAQPMRIYGASATSGGFRAAVKVLSWEAFHASIDDGRGVTSILPQAIGVDSAWPNLNVKVFPTPAASPGSLELDYWTVLAQFALVSSTVTLPPGFQDALHFNLATRLYPQYARAGGPDQALLLNAQITKAAITALNAEILGTAPEPTDTQSAPPKGAAQ